MFKIQIPKPCHEDWNAMTLTQQDAFCGACNKEVIDFTKMTDEEVQHYFLNRTTDKTCGHFRKEQVDRIRIHLPENILLQKIASWKKFMAVVMLAFGTMLFGCDVKTNDDLLTGIIAPVSVYKKQTALTGDTVLPGEWVDTVSHPISNTTRGETAICFKKDSINTINDTKEMPPTMDGMIELVPIDTINNLNTPDNSQIFKGEISLEKKKDSVTKKPASDTNKCKDTGYY